MIRSTASASAPVIGGGATSAPATLVRRQAPTKGV